MDKPRPNAILSAQFISFLLGKKSQVNAKPGRNSMKTEKNVLKISIIIK